MKNSIPTSKHPVSYQLGFRGEGKPGEVVTLRRRLEGWAGFKPEKLAVATGVTPSQALGYVREVRLPGKRLKVDERGFGGLRPMGDYWAQFWDSLVLKVGEEIEIDVEMPPSGTFVCAIFGWAMEQAA